MSALAGVTASVLLAELLDGPPCDLHLAHRTRLVCQLANDEGRVVACVILPGSLRLPHAAVVPSIPRGSSPVSVGDGSLGWDGFRSPISRWWRPSRPVLPSLDIDIDDTTAAHFADTWSDLVGLGPGLTPYADDVICGSLVTLHAAGHPAAELVSAEILASPLERRTSATSAALLRHAAAGYCIDQLADFLCRPSALTVQRLVAVGHSSGHGYLEGVTNMLPAMAPEVAAA